MMNLQNQNIRKLVRITCCALSVLLSLGWLGFIFSNSLKSGSESGAQSSKVHQTVNQVAQSVGIKQEISEQTVREGAHFTEFAILAALICLVLLSFWRLLRGTSVFRLMLISLSVIPICAVFAAVDEFLQTFFAGRSAQATDVFLDTAGAAASTVFFAVILSAVILIQKKKERKQHESQ